jgi:predicted dehydrogenase
MHRKLNLAIFGTGNIASGGYGPALQSSYCAQLWSVLSRDLKRGTEFSHTFNAQSKNPAHTSIDALLQDPELDAVIIATPDKLHAEQAIRAAKAGKHILLEKPLATDSNGIVGILKNCCPPGITLGLCYRLRWHSGHRALVEAVHRGDFGDIHHVRTFWTFKNEDASNWRASPEVGRWWSLGSMGTHLIDLSRWILSPSQGEVDRISSVTTNKLWKGPHDETAVVALRFAGGATAEICTTVLFDAPSRLEIYGSKGWAVCEDTFGREAAGRILTHEGPLPFTAVNPFVALIANFVNAIRTGTAPEVDVFEGARNAEILLKCADISP